MFYNLIEHWYHARFFYIYVSKSRYLCTGYAIYSKGFRRKIGSNAFLFMLSQNIAHYIIKFKLYVHGPVCYLAWHRRNWEHVLSSYLQKLEITYPYFIVYSIAGMMCGCCLLIILCHSCFMSFTKWILPLQGPIWDLCHSFNIIQENPDDVHCIHSQRQWSEIYTKPINLLHTWTIQTKRITKNTTLKLSIFFFFISWTICCTQNVVPPKGCWQGPKKRCLPISLYLQYGHLK